MKKGRPGRLVNLFGQNSFKQILLVSFLPLGLPLYQLYFRKQVKNCLWRDIFRDVVNARCCCCWMFGHSVLDRRCNIRKSLYRMLRYGPERSTAKIILRIVYDTSSWFDLQTFDFNYLSSLLFTSSSITFLPSYEL